VRSNACTSKGIANSWARAKCWVLPGYYLRVNYLSTTVDVDALAVARAHPPSCRKSNAKKRNEFIDDRYATATQYYIVYYLFILV
jgi:4'-phosphopantetheinyl transferase EntD